jgi:hypothetical protein
MHSPEIERILTPHERAVSEWLLTNGDMPEGERTKFLAQLERAVVIRQCTCGCASIDFRIEGLPEPKADFCFLGDFVTAENNYGMFVFAKEGVLAGVEVYQMAAERPSSVLPDTVGRRVFHPTA